jgi:uncharacterized damage-inducible protein DinB
MSAAIDLLEDALSRVKENVHAVTDGLSADDLAFQPASGANSIGWLLWHLTRVQDDHVAEVAGTPQVWTSQDWADRFALPLSQTDTGWGHSGEQVAAVQVKDAGLLTGYYDAVHEQTLTYLRGLSDEELTRVVDERWDPPVTLAVRLVSVIDDDAQHVGQAAYLRGLLPA